MSGIDAGIRVGKYEVGRKLGQGGFGVLYVARDHELGRDVAIKFLRPEHAFKPTVVQRFLQEARAAARINHPGIVTVFESGIVGGTNTRADGTVYIAMELLAGDTLATKIKSHKRLPATLALNYARQLASALGAAHMAGIVHRDLKPANVFVVSDSAVVGGERLKVLDFGIAKLVDDFGSNVQTHSMLMLGTPMYMSPEQCKSSAKVDARSDVYSLGCILFEMLCGKPPFEGDSGELIAKHQLVPPPTPRSVVGELPVPLDRLITSMLAKSADDRPQTMAMVEDALSDLDSRALERPSLMGETSPEVDQFAPTTMQPSAMRRRLPFVAGGLGAAALGIIVGLFTMCGDKKTTAQAKVVEDASVVANVEPPPPPTADAPPAPSSPPTVAPAPTAEETAKDCEAHVASQEWSALLECADRLAALDPALAEKFRARVPPGEPKCDADELKDKGMENINVGQHAAALAQFEASLRCKNDPYVLSLTFMAACNAQNAGKARQYWKQLSSTQQSKFRVICIRNHIDPAVDDNAAPDKSAAKPVAKTVAKATPSVAAPANCDANALKEKGMENINMGQHAAALAQFEASLRCKNDRYVLGLAFMAACNAQNAGKAKAY